MKWVRKLLLLGVVFLLPLVVSAFSANLVVRMPDFYQYEFNRTNITSELRISLKNTELAGLFSDFMWGKSEELVLEQEYTGPGEEQNVFLPEEQAAMKRLRSILNVISLVAAASVIPIVTGYFLSIRSGEKERLRQYFLLSIPVLLGYGALCVYIVLDEKVAAGLRNLCMGGPLPESGVLASVFTQEFTAHSLGVAGAIALVVYIILGMVTWNSTRPYHMFHQGRRTRYR